MAHTEVCGTRRRISDPNLIAGLLWGDVRFLLNIDKKARDEGIYFALPRSIGTVEVVGNIDDIILRRAMEQISPPE